MNIAVTGNIAAGTRLGVLAQYIDVMSNRLFVLNAWLRDHEGLLGDIHCRERENHER